jgi:putative addiction module component (TIGR02574 family)
MAADLYAAWHRRQLQYQQSAYRGTRMTPTLESLGIDRMTLPERAALAQAIWDSIAAEAETAPLTETQKLEINRRLAKHGANPQAAILWEQIEAEALARMILTHNLNPDEIVRLLQVLWDYEPAVQKQELQEELRCILAARELATKPKLTNETVDKAREAFASGRVPFVQQDMD